jgi:hypothetical protein
LLGSPEAVIVFLRILQSLKTLAFLCESRFDRLMKLLILEWELLEVKFSGLSMLCHRGLRDFHVEGS